MNFFDVTNRSSANPFALFAVAQSPREAYNQYRIAQEYSYTELGLLTRAAQSSVKGSSAEGKSPPPSATSWWSREKFTI